MSQFVNLNLTAGRNEKVFAEFNISTSGNDILETPSEYSVGVNRFKIPLSSIPKYRFYEKELAFTMLSDAGSNVATNAIVKGKQNPTNLLSTFLDLDCLNLTNYGTFGIDVDNNNKKYKDIFSEAEFLDIMNISAAHGFYEFGRQQSSFASNVQVVDPSFVNDANQLLMGIGDTQVRNNGNLQNNGYITLLNFDVPLFNDAITTTNAVAGTTLDAANTAFELFPVSGTITIVGLNSQTATYTGKSQANDQLTGVVMSGTFIAACPIGTTLRAGDYSSVDAQIEEVAQNNRIICGFELELKSLGATLGTEDFSNFDFILERNPILTTSTNGTYNLDIARANSGDTNQLYFNNGILNGLVGVCGDGFDADQQISFGTTTKYHIEAQKMVNADVINAYRGASLGGSKLAGSSANGIFIPIRSFLGNALGNTLGRVPPTFGSLDVFNDDGTLLDRITYTGTNPVAGEAYLQLDGVQRTNPNVLHPKWTNCFVSGSTLPTTRPNTGFSLFPTAMDVNGFLGKSYEGYNYRLRVRNKMAYSHAAQATCPSYFVPSINDFGDFQGNVGGMITTLADVEAVKPTLTLHTFEGRPIDVQNTNYEIQGAAPNQLGRQRVLYQTDFLAPRFVFNDDGLLGLSINERYLADYNMSIYMNDQMSSLINFQKYKTLPIRGTTNFGIYFDDASGAFRSLNSDRLNGHLYRFAGEVGKYDTALNPVSLNGSNLYYETYSSESFRDMLNSVVITTGRLAVDGEYVGDGSSTRKMLTDFETDPSSIGRNYALFYNNGGMRLYPLLSDTPIKQVDAQIFYQDIFGVLRRLEVKPNEECSIKLEFRPNIGIYSQTGAIDNFNIS